MKKLIIANRGEIARRIIAASQAYGLKTIAVYTQEEIGAAFITAADEAYLLPGSGGSAYLQGHNLIAIAQESKAIAIHPGYGFLSESASFAQDVLDAGLLWVGPSPSTIKTMGDKVEARALAEKLSIPVIPGASFKSNQNGLREAQAFAIQIGFPVIVKNPLGGGGKGIKAVSSLHEFPQAWQGVINESRLLPQSDFFLVEKYITHGRHIEIQVIGDGKNYLHAYERECSLQRKHQKIIEEAPCNFIAQATKEKMYSWALALTEAVNYQGVGTVEFLVKDEVVYFLEMNTRLQVEHSVTEMVTGIDLVQEQLHIAFEQSLSFTQKDLFVRGHAVQARIYAENPYDNYLPSTGVLAGVEFPHQPHVRIDHDLFPGLEISAFFDPMVAKITAYGFDRHKALKTLDEALRLTSIAGITTNKRFLQALIKNKDVIAGALHTKLLNDPSFFSTLTPPDSSLTITSALLEKIKNIFTQIAESSVYDKKQERASSQGWRDQLWSK